MKKTIRSQIMKGYFVMIAVPVIITLVAIVSLFGINSEVQLLNQNRTNQNMTKDAVVGHYSWMMNLGDAILEGTEFTGSLDPTTCSLGKWMAAVAPEDLKDPTIALTLQSLTIPHNEIHTEAQRLIEKGKTNPQATHTEYMKNIKPKVKDIIDNIDQITNQYMKFSEQATVVLSAKISRLMLICVVLAAFGILAALLIGNRTAKQIAKPIELVADCSQKLAMGSDNMNLEEIDHLDLGKDNEATIMIDAFRLMVKSIQNNVSVVKRVAEGDLTAFVDIRSSSDSLGKNLYHMVQSNDLMFAQILDIAGEVASNANQISQASHALANSATEQASSTEQLSNVAIEVNELTMQNKQKVNEVITVFGHISKDIKESGDKMNRLVDAVTEIALASDQISAVIKTIDDIAFQTNILALNAAVEAARAGTAGKGFAVVADEVRNLASKSASAAEETKALIENTIRKAHSGNQMAQETSETFQKINSDLTRTTETVNEIAHASEQQVIKVEGVHQSIDALLSISTSNAASCEQSSAASQEMYRCAGQLRNAMKKFNLRQRHYGQAYIPPEKQNDPEFIRTATENYERSIQKSLLKEQELEKIC